MHHGGYGGYQGAFTLQESCHHPGLPVNVGPYQIYLGANRAISIETAAEMDYICALNGSMVDDHKDALYGRSFTYINCELPDRGGVPEVWPEFIQYIIGLLKAKKKVLAYCIGGHGRTGTFGASLISVLEPECPDPIDAIRDRHCLKGVESRKQAIAIYGLRGKKLPPRYRSEFKEWKQSAVIYTPSTPTSSPSSTSSVNTNVVKPSTDFSGI
jgi:hypothetical protein